METEIDRPRWYDHLLHGALVLVTIIILRGLVGCSVMDGVEICMEHPRYGQVCVTVVGGKVARITAKTVDITDPEVIDWAQERVR